MNSNVIKNERENERESEKKTEVETENGRFVMINGISGQFKHDTVVKKKKTAY